MKKARVTKVMAVTFLVALLVMSVLGSCAKPAPAPAPAPAPKPAAAPAPAPKLDPLAQVIEGAKKEGTVSAFIVSAFSPTPIVQALEKAIKDKYGVDMKIIVGGAGRGMGQEMATAIMEHQTGTTPSMDLMGFSTAYLPEGIKAGAFEIVDWAALVEKGTLPDMIPQEPGVRGSIVYLSTANGLVYNPTKISAAEAPKKITDLLDPKWKGRLGVFSYTSYWAEWAFVLGKDGIYNYMRSLVKTKPLIDEFTKLNNRYLLGEIDLAFMNAAYIIQNRSKGVPTAFRNLDIINVYDGHLLVRKGAKHANAAKLLATFFTTPEGVKFLVEKTQRGTIYVPGNYMYDLYQEGLKEGLKLYKVYNYPGVMDFISSPEYGKWQKEADLIMQGA